MLLLGSLVGTLLGMLMAFLSVFLILLILIQRGKGGGLTGALGGPGGQSAFGSKAGDTFTVITIVVASLWGFTCVLTMLILGTDPTPPAIANEPNISAGPGDEDEAINSLVIPPIDGLEGLGLGGAATDTSTPTGDASSNSSTSGETPSMDLTPAQSPSGASSTSEPTPPSNETAAEAAETESAPAETPSTESPE